MSRLDDIKARLDLQDDMALRYDDLDVLVAVVEEVQRVREGMTEAARLYGRDNPLVARVVYAIRDGLDAALRPITEEGQK